MNGFVEDCSNSSALAMELLQSCIKHRYGDVDLGQHWVQVLACYLLGAKPSPKPMFTHYRFSPGQFNQVPTYRMISGKW